MDLGIANVAWVFAHAGCHDAAIVETLAGEMVRRGLSI
jgi:hypothetical protein